jgi:hypothetical protein
MKRINKMKIHVNMHIHDQVSLLFMTRELSSMTTIPFLFFSFYISNRTEKEEKKERRI